MLPNEIARVLERMRLDRGWSQGRLALEIKAVTGLSLTAATLSRLENGLCCPSKLTLHKLTTFLGVEKAENVNN